MIGGTLAAMALLVVLSLMVWTGVLPVPLDPGFSSASDDATPVVQPCPPANAVTVEVTSFPVNVYNGTDTAGLAGVVADALSDAGIVVSNTSDWPKGAYTGEVQLTTSESGLVNAYSLARIFTGTVVVQIDENQDPADATVSVVLGEEYAESILSAGEISMLRAGEAISAPSGCASPSASSQG